jgi:NADPH:quinone reductase-like Zn-dependent oxidoreductase
MRAVQLTAYGNPVDGLEYADIPEPDAPGPSQVLIGVEFSPINFSDLLVAQGASIRCAPRSQPLSAMKASAAFLP